MSCMFFTLGTLERPLKSTRQLDRASYLVFFSWVMKAISWYNSF